MLGRQSTGPMAVIIRHADRNDIASVTDSLGVGLNDKGRREARSFGEKVRGEHEVRLFHSPAVRCRETAEAIAAGLVMNGNRVVSSTETWDLCAPYLLDERTLEVADRLGHDFLRAWFGGHLDEGWILPAREASDKVLRPIIDLLIDEASPSRLDIHVSHDWEIVLLREILFDTRYEEAGWVEYLDGLVFVKGENGVQAMMGDSMTMISLPRRDNEGG